MPKKKEEKKEVVKDEKPKEEVKKEEPKKPKKKKKEKQKVEELKDLGTLGIRNIKIHYKGKKVVNGKEYLDIHLINGETMLLSDDDFKKQHTPPKK